MDIIPEHLYYSLPYASEMHGKHWFQTCEQAQNPALPCSTQLFGPSVSSWSLPEATTGSVVSTCFFLSLIREQSSGALQICSAIPQQDYSAEKKSLLKLNNSSCHTCGYSTWVWWEGKEKKRKKEREKKREKKISLAQRISHCKCRSHENDNRFISSLIKISLSIFSRQEESQ